MTKLLTLLLLLQTLLIALLYAKVDAVEEQVNQAAAPIAIEMPQPVSDPAPAPPVQSSNIDKAELRSIIREELRHAPLEWAAVQRENEASSGPFYDEAEMEKARNNVMRSLDYLRTQDEVSQAELDLLLADIARLDPERRSEAMKELNRAMNRGEIRGNL